MKHQAEACRKHVIKFSAFMNRNSNMPCCLKKKVMEAALLSAMLYASESWITDGLKTVNQHYMAAVKLLLGVRRTTPHVLCLIEAGLPDLSSKILKRHCNFMTSFAQRTSQDEPLAQALRLCAEANTDMYRRLMAAQNYVGDPEMLSRQTLQEECRRLAESATRFSTYLSLNPSLTCHDVYVLISSTPDNLHKDFTRLRLSSHRLFVERGRWSRIPRERRVCDCDHESVQDELHIALPCPRTQNVRDTHGATYSSLDELFSSELNVPLVCHELLKTFE